MAMEIENDSIEKIISRSRIYFDKKTDSFSCYILRNTEKSLDESEFVEAKVSRNGLVYCTHCKDNDCKHSRFVKTNKSTRKFLAKNGIKKLDPSGVFRNSKDDLIICIQRDL